MGSRELTAERQISVVKGGASLGLAEELQADVPQVVPAVHVARVGCGQLAGVGPVPGFLHDDVGAAVRAGHEQPRVVSQPLAGGAVPADPAAEFELVDRAVDAGAEGDPVEGDAGAQYPAGASTTTSLALEYQEGQVDARTRWFQTTSVGALTTMSLCANRSARSGLTSPGQWMCADRRWTSSMIDTASLLIVCVVSMHRMAKARNVTSRDDPSEVPVNRARSVPDRVVIGRQLQLFTDMPVAFPPAESQDETRPVVFLAAAHPRRRSRHNAEGRCRGSNSQPGGPFCVAIDGIAPRGRGTKSDE